MVGGWKLTWGDESRVVASDDPEALVAAVRDAMQAVANSGVVLELLAPSGAEMTLGIGQPSVATFKASEEPPYYVSQGTTTSSSSDETLVFFREGHHSEFGGDAGISAGDALDVVIEFITTGERPTCIAWSEV